MSPNVRCVSAIQKYRRTLIVVVLTLITSAASGTLIVGDDSLLAGVDSVTPESQAAENIDATVDDSTSGTTLLVHRDWSGANTSLSKSALFESLEPYMEIRGDQSTAPTPPMRRRQVAPPTSQPVRL